MTYCAKRLSAFLAVLAMAVLAAPAMGDPLLYLSVQGRVQGSGNPFSSAVSVTSTSQVIEYQVVVEMANLGASVQVGYSGSGSSTTPVYATINSLQGAVNTTYYDGVNSLKFNLSQLPTDATQVNPHSPTLGSGWTLGLGSSTGTAAARGSTGCNDILGVRPAVAFGVYLGVPADNTHVPIVVASGTAAVTKVGSGTSYLVVSDKLPSLIDNSSSAVSAVFRINNTADVLNSTPGDTYPKIGFNNLAITTGGGTLPNVSITAPTTGLIGGQGWQITLSATCTNGSGGTVTGVKFYDGATLLGTATWIAGGAWTYKWDTTLASIASHSLAARATDGSGQTGSSNAVSVEIRLAADGNNDHIVDGLDYGVWQNGYLQSNSTFLTGDYNGDGVVDGLDYGTWQNNYLRTASSSDVFAAVAAQGTDASTPMAQAQVQVPAAVVGGAPRLVAVTPAPGAVASGVTSLTLVFDSDVQTSAKAVEVSGLATGAHQDYTAAYDSATHTLTLIWTQALPTDVYTVRVVADFVVGASGGTPLDGEVGNPVAATLPSGDGIPGGDVRLEFEVR
jgi:methionine-rich copper-binding protein CopC